MKQFFVIDVDSSSPYVHVHQVQQDFDANGVVYRRDSTSMALIVERPSPRFYGQFGALLLTSDRIADAEPIMPEPAFSTNSHDPQPK